MKTLLKVVIIIAVYFLVSWGIGLTLAIFGLKGTEFGALWFNGFLPRIAFLSTVMIIISTIVKGIKNKVTGKA